MPFDGRGRFTRTDGTRRGTNVFVQQQEGSIDPSPTLFDNTHNDMVTGLELAILRDGQNTPSADLPMNGHKHTNVGTASARNEYATFGQLQDLAAANNYVQPGDVSMNATTITLTPDPARTAHRQGDTYIFQVEAVNTGAVNVIVNSLGSVSLTKWGTIALSPGDLQLGAMIMIVYDGTRFQVVGLPRYREVFLSRSAYNAATKDPNTIYNIV